MTDPDRKPGSWLNWDADEAARELAPWPDDAPTLPVLPEVPEDWPDRGRRA